MKDEKYTMPKKELPALTSIRFIAAFLIFVFHEIWICGDIIIYASFLKVTQEIKEK